MECSSFLNWDEEDHESEQEKAVVFRSLVATVKLQPALDASLVAKAVKLLKSVDQKDSDYADGFLISLGGTPDESLTNFVSSILVLISSSNRVITTAMVKILKTLIIWCSTKVRLALVKADLIPQLMNTLNPQSLSFAEGVNIHINLMKIITSSLWLATPDAIRRLAITDANEQQAVHETILKQILVPSEKYIRHLCVDRFSIVDGKQSKSFLELLTHLLKICPYYRLTMDFILHMPVVLTTPSCLAFFEDDEVVWYFLCEMVEIQREWNRESGYVRETWKTVHQKLRMEGIEDAMMGKLQNDQNGYFGGLIVAFSIEWNNLQSMNLSD
ncbi:hypothetical protein BLNAU_7400 [Blattamonas nauphoetae]|uniref:Uncharacterized protein n=1 Tax=Blattamonas nauphoetae TaxID=2049346 RepID=A0ABQ9Y180_9EUKA|nr:hypothetical protein BLNAU_7400 [Blattamonas nauphoetae]